MDREKVIKGLESCIANNCRDCPYPCCCEYADDWPHELHEDALALLKEQEAMMQCIKGKCLICPHCANCDVDDNGLLKEQEAVEPTIDEYGNKRCGNCGHKLQSIADMDLFCCKCGRSVKWE